MFLSHINILRGIAILLIILFHLDSELFPNGYLGVEVFFVISGYLLFRSHDEKGTPSVRDFTRKKIIRLFPPLIVVLMLTILASQLFILYDAEMLEMLKTAVYALAALSNSWLNKGHGYFSPDTANNPLMHTWYISVILQIFLIYIVVAFLTKNYSRRFCYIIFSLLGFASLLYTITFTASGMGNPENLYYSTPARVWEVWSGALAIPLTKTKANSLFRACTSTICLGIIIVMSSVPMLIPTSIAVPMVITCSVCVIAYGSQLPLIRTPYAKLLDLAGTLSFSMYLVHYPLIVFFKTWNEGDLQALNVLACISTIILAAVLLYRLIEKKRFHLITACFLWGGVFATAVLFIKLPALRTYIPNRSVQYPGLTAPVLRPAPRYDDIDADVVKYHSGVLSILQETNKQAPRSLLYQVGSPDATPEFVLIGDSNAMHLFAGLDAICKDTNKAGIYINSIFIPFWEMECGMDCVYQCGPAKFQAFFNWLDKHKEITHIIVGQYWEWRFGESWKLQNKEGKEVCDYPSKVQALRNFCRQVRLHGREIILIAPAPNLEHLSKKDTESNLLKHKRIRDMKGEAPDFLTYTQTSADYDKYNRKSLEALRQLEDDRECKVLHIREAIFGQGEPYHAYDPKTSAQYHRDFNHLTPLGSVLLMKKLKNNLLELLLQRTDTESGTPSY